MLHTGCMPPRDNSSNISSIWIFFFWLLKMKHCKKWSVKKTGLKVINVVEVIFRWQFQYFKFSYTFSMNLVKKTEDKFLLALWSSQLLPLDLPTLKYSIPFCMISYTSFLYCQIHFCCFVVQLFSSLVV